MVCSSLSSPSVIWLRRRLTSSTTWVFNVCWQSWAEAWADAGIGVGGTLSRKNGVCSSRGYYVSSERLGIALTRLAASVS